jgi:LysM repeat protein
LPVEKVGDFLAHEKEIYAASEIKRPEPELADTTTNENGSEVTTKIVWEDEWKSHKVKKGETLKSIASKYGVSSSDVKKWNKMSSSTVKIGQSLKIKVRVKKTITVPAPKDEKVEGGQAENKMSEEEAKKKAEEEAKKKAADEAKRKADEEAKKKQQQTDAKVEYVYHTVKSGETLSKIANTHKVSVDSIVKLNKGLNPNKLMVGQKIKVKKKK